MTPGSPAAWLAAHRREIVDELAEWVRIPSVGGRPEREGERRESAAWLAALLRAVGFPHVEVWPASDVWAEWRTSPAAPTVLVYSHHDVRAVKDELWERSRPFEPTLRGARLYGRGTSDAKGQVLAHLWGLRAYLATSGRADPPVNLRLLIEAEEEVGSPHLAEVLADHAGQVEADLVVLSDTMLWAADAPALCTGVRGRVGAQLEVRGPSSDIHAGAVSGAVPNPATELAAVLARLRDADGRITVPGFYDDVREPDADERAALGRLSADESAWLARIGSRRWPGEPGRSLAERLYTRPSVEVLSLAAGDTDGPSRGTIPAAASAEIMFTLVPDQDPITVGEQLRAWVRDAMPEHVTYALTVTDDIDQPPYATPPDHPALPILAGAMAEAWGRPVARMRNAGAAPAVLLAERVRAPVVFFGTGLPEDAWHAPDESVQLDVLLAGAATLALFWPRLAAGLTPRRR